MEIYKSELKVICEAFWQTQASSPRNGTLYGLWTHTGKVVVQLAVPDGEDKKYCRDQGLVDVGKFTSSRHDRPSRPSYIVHPMSYIWIFPKERGDVEYCTIGTHSPSPLRDVGTLPYISPYRYAKNPEKFTYDKADELEGPSSARRGDAEAGLSTHHWAREPEHSRFLQSLTTQLKRKGFEVKQVQQPGSDYIALFIEYKQRETSWRSSLETSLSWAVGFPTDFPSRREVSITKGGEKNPTKIRLHEHTGLEELIKGLGLRQLPF
ncbi:uncharacterized protein [Oscarella lobularis]|uniref:uncharacterized protein n=1 Tax=Oscarella lobularis TaxID=121494 RepID=UPI003313443B